MSKNLEEKINKMLAVSLMILPFSLASCSSVYINRPSFSGEITSVEYCKKMDPATKRCLEYYPAVSYGGNKNVGTKNNVLEK